MNVIFSALLIVLFACGCERKHSELRGSYRVSADGGFQVLYLNTGIALIVHRGIAGASIVSAHWAGSPSYKSSTGDQIGETLIDLITALNQDSTTGIIYGARYPEYDGKGFFLIKGMQATLFSNANDLQRQLPKELRTKELILLPVDLFVKMNTRNQGKKREMGPDK